MASISVQGTQWIRSASLIVSKGSQTVVQTQGNGLDLSALQFRFTVRSADTESPNTLVVRVYNLSDNTAKAIIKEYDTVSLQAGYKNSTVGVIFSGTVKQFKRGRERNVDSYLEITAGNNDLGYCFGMVNASLAAGSSNADVVKQCAAALQVSVDDQTLAYAATGGVFPRGRVLFGMARAEMRTVANSLGARWSIQGGKLVLIPQTSYLPGDAVVLNSATGLVGIPEATDSGIEIECLLNPLLQIGQRVQIANSLINSTTTLDHFRPNLAYVANVTMDGFYRILTLDHTGDTRGDEFYSNMTCLSIDQSSPVATSVKAWP